MATTTQEREVVLVSGVGRREGIGFELCRQLGAHGMTVLLSARRAEAAHALAAELSEGQGLDVRPLALDVTDAAAVAALPAQLPRLDVLVHNAAGTAPYGERVDGADLDVAHAVLEATLFGGWRLAQALLPRLREAPNGRIVFVSSGAGSHADAGFGLTSGNAMGASYAVAKAALNALTARLAHEEPALRVNAVCPGFTATFPGGAEMGARPVRDGAASVAWAVGLDRHGPTGGFFRDGRPLGW